MWNLKLKIFIRKFQETWNFFILILLKFLIERNFYIIKREKLICSLILNFFSQTFFLATKILMNQTYNVESLLSKLMSSIFFISFCLYYIILIIVSIYNFCLILTKPINSLSEIPVNVLSIYWLNENEYFIERKLFIWWDNFFLKLLSIRNNLI